MTLRATAPSPTPRSALAGAFLLLLVGAMGCQPAPLETLRPAPRSDAAGGGADGSQDATPDATNDTTPADGGPQDTANVGDTAGAADTQGTGDAGLQGDGGDDAGTQPWPLPEAQLHVSLSGVSAGLCAVLGGQLWLRNAVGAPFVKKEDAASLGFEPLAVWCEAPGQHLVVGGINSQGQAALAVIKGPGTPTELTTLGFGQVTAIHGRFPFDATAIGAQNVPGGASGWGATGAPGASATQWTANAGLTAHPALLALFVRDDGVRVAAGVGGTLLRSVDGAAWAAPSPPGPSQATLRGVWSSAAGPFHAVGDANTMLQQTGKDGGWQQAPTTTPPGISWRAISGYPEGTALAVGGDKIAFWNGSSWSTPPTQGLPPGVKLSAIRAVPELGKRILFVGAHPMVWRCELLPKPPVSVVCENKPVITSTP